MKSLTIILMCCVICSDVIPIEADGIDIAIGIISGFAGREAEKKMKKNVEIELPPEINMILTIVLILFWTMLCLQNPGVVGGAIMGGILSDIVNPSDD